STAAQETQRAPNHRRQRRQPFVKPRLPFIQSRTARHSSGPHLRLLRFRDLTNKFIGYLFEGKIVYERTSGRHLRLSRMLRAIRRTRWKRSGIMADCLSEAKSGPASSDGGGEQILPD